MFVRAGEGTETGAQDPVSEQPSQNFRWLDKACLPMTNRRTGQVAPGFKLYQARPPSLGVPAEANRKGPNRVSQVEEVKLVLGTLGVWACLIMYWAIYAQMGSMFVMQGEQMRREFRVGSWKVNVPSASLSAVNTISIIVLIPLWDQVLMPYLGRIGRKPSMLQRIGKGLGPELETPAARGAGIAPLTGKTPWPPAGWGMVVAVLAMLSCVWIERARLRAAADRPLLPPRERGAPPEADISILWQIIPYWLVGASEILTAIGALEFFYQEAPDVMRSCMMALELASSALGSYLAGLLVFSVDISTSETGPHLQPSGITRPNPRFRLLHSS